MPIREIMDVKAFGNEEEKISLIMALNCAPVIKGSRAANVLSVTGREFVKISALLRNTNISCLFINAGGPKGILYLYREKELKEYLEKEEIKSFLEAYGYQTGNIRVMLKRLAGRIRLYHGRKEEFPHEIGIFLGYPVKDVKGFIENDGKNFAYVGYWKVYHNVQETLGLFRRYDEEREQAVREIMQGRTIQEIAV